MSPLNGFWGSNDFDRRNCLSESFLLFFVLIVLTQQGTRCSYGPGESGKQLRAHTTAVEPEAEFVQVQLVILAAAMICSKKKSFEVTDGGVQPFQITSCKLLSCTFHIFEAMVTLIAVTFHGGPRFQMRIHKGLQRRSLYLRL